MVTHWQGVNLWQAWWAESIGADSVDGTGFFRGGPDSPQARQLVRFIERKQGSLFSDVVDFKDGGNEMEEEIETIVNNIYDPVIEGKDSTPYNGIIGSVVKAWLRQAVRGGIKLGRKEMGLKIEEIIQESLNPDYRVIVTRIK